MKLEIIAAAIESVYYAGRPKSSKKMDREDFAQLARMANASIMRKLYFQASEQENVYLYFADQIETREFEVSEPDSRNRRTFDLEEQKEIVRLPNGIGIFAIMLVGDLPAAQRKFHVGEAGSEWLYSGEEYAGTLFYVRKGKRIHLYNMPRNLKTVEMDGIFNDEEIEIPEDVAFDIVNAVLGAALQTTGFPVDKTDDNNPNVTTVRKALAEPSSL